MFRINTLNTPGSKLTRSQSHRELFGQADPQQNYKWNFNSNVRHPDQTSLTQKQDPNTGQPRLDSSPYPVRSPENQCFRDALHSPTCSEHFDGERTLPQQRPPTRERDLNQVQGQPRPRCSSRVIMFVQHRAELLLITVAAECAAVINKAPQTYTFQMRN